MLSQQDMLEAERHGRQVRSIYVYEAPVRLWHWINALAIVVLAVSGYFIGKPLPTMPGEASDNFPPALMAMLSSGALQPLIEAALGSGNNASDASAAQKKSADFLRQFEGRTGITRLNSTQVFAGMPPMKIQMNAVFRAWDDPASEVEAPFDKLIQWAIPVSLSKDGSILARAAKTARGEMSYVEALFPSAAPVRIAMTYKGRTYCPMVIESIGKPLDAPVDRNGRHVHLVIPMTLCSLTALDREMLNEFKTMKL